MVFLQSYDTEDTDGFSYFGDCSSGCAAFHGDGCGAFRLYVRYCDTKSGIFFIGYFINH